MCGERIIKAVDELREAYRNKCSTLRIVVRQDRAIPQADFDRMIKPQS